ncbi:hypothetical protein KIN20_032009 [Parelaphostrongylus tenuis]|uniref:Uncharacterized protein n=1 Tax=Parelaphostrongylus tenuis TaxID=148309 RepID=A0AAD5R5Z9_PARTN|nr:hypothetical protein KIN20_032009 [Parelaphostrongylus tenuis]
MMEFRSEVETGNNNNVAKVLFKKRSTDTLPYLQRLLLTTPPLAPKLVSELVPVGTRGCKADGKENVNDGTPQSHRSTVFPSYSLV